MHTRGNVYPVPAGFVHFPCLWHWVRDHRGESERVLDDALVTGYVRMARQIEAARAASTRD